MTAAPVNDLDADYTPRYIWLAKLLRGWIKDGTYGTVSAVCDIFGLSKEAVPALAHRTR